MQLIRGLHNLTSFQKVFAKGCALTIGNFDGIHLGHQTILQQLHEHAQRQQVPAVVMVFEPLPAEYFGKENVPVRLMNLREKLNAFQNTEIDYVLVCRFDETFAQLTAQAFVENILLDGLNVKHVVIGDDFCFGKHRQGNFAFLQQQGAQHGFSVSDMATYEVNGERVSSTRVREALAKHDLADAKALLGTPFYFHGRVVHGKKLGRKIGFRTLNLNPKRAQMPLEGVYTVKVSGLAEQAQLGIANIGIRPTVDGFRPSIEVHLFGWQKEVYGAHVGVQIEQFIRPEMKFDSVDQLVAQIEQDVEVAKQLLNI